MVSRLCRALPPAGNLALLRKRLDSPPWLRASRHRPCDIENRSTVFVFYHWVRTVLEHERDDPAIVEERLVMKVQRRQTVVVDGVDVAARLQQLLCRDQVCAVATQRFVKW